MAAQRIEKTRYPGVYRVHERGCASTSCRCSRYQAAVYSARDGKLIRKHFETLGEAKLWRSEAVTAVQHGKMRAPTSTTVEQAGKALIEGMKSGAVYDRSGKPYKPSTIRGYERTLRLHVVPHIGKRPVSKLERREIQALVELWHGQGLAASTIHNALNPLQVICRRAVYDGTLAIDPTEGLRLPAIRGGRDRVADRKEAAALLDALPEGERALWATAFYAGLRRGELRALRWDDIELASEPARIRVRRTWDDHEGEVDAKTEAGDRTIPLTGRLRSLLVEHGLTTRRAGDDLVFGASASQPFTASTVRRRARGAWEAAGLEPLTPHEARHCAASYLIEAGLNDLELMATIGHSDPRTTKKIYGHLFPDSGATIAAKLDSYLEAAEQEG